MASNSRSTVGRNTNEVLMDEHGTCFVLPGGISLEETLLLIRELIGYENIRAASWMNHKVVVFVSQVHFAPNVAHSFWVMTSLYWFCHETLASKKILSNVLPMLSNEEILQKLGQYSTVVSWINKAYMRTTDGKLKHTKTFRRFWV